MFTGNSTTSSLDTYLISRKLQPFFFFFFLSVHLYVYIYIYLSFYLLYIDRYCGLDIG